jgi:MFS family permease
VPKPLGDHLRWTTIGIALTLGARDFSGVASISLVSIYLQKAQHMNAAVAGFIVGLMMLIGVLANPVAVWVSPGRLRLPMLAGILLIAGVVISAIPFVSSAMLLPVLCGYQACQLGSYAMSDAAMLERVPAALRGRVVGLFLMIAGTAAATSPWIMGYWTDAFGARASQPLTYVGPFILLGATMWFAVLAMPLIGRLGPVQGGAIEPMAEILPRTMEPVM